MSAPGVDHDAPFGRLARLRWRFLSLLATIGRATRAQMRFTLMFVGVAWGVVCESVRPHSWRRTTRLEFRRCVREIVAGGLLSVLVTAVLAGIGVVSQTVYWLGFAGLAQMTGSILVSVLVRDVAPILVGIILLGRNGMLSTAELGLLNINGQIRGILGVGLDPFTLLLLPRAVAFMLGGFTLGIIFSVTTLVMGYMASRVTGAINSSVWSFFTDVVSSMGAIDFVLIPVKFVLVGFFVGTGSCLTGLMAAPQDDVSSLLPVAFTRGITMVMVVTILFSLSL
ncbi:ABC transporter permease [Ameyamaea chiangmaiensis NBRC 103196]|uniref:ABC transporter permease n=1 Tax=Ameyamaea chiangmaiensis TaxID=442969 RepID=A0A850PIC6_9PROT|nr:ABC transporter permease [Ameyamaea chiangmaiensis]MBS4074849.1 ABC transporter permease [Ameyamaea chiangmaiensis]NVN41562.1 ABC transporter permease [Ameyamaea chiangmaiensis]GBQ62970.1 ABC transporter permease [Ameyamaea chiangmaiensis NBRC 103196]